MKKVFVTGGSGFIGTHLTNELLARGNAVYLMVLPEITDYDALPKSERLVTVNCSLKNISKLPLLLEERGFDVFYHLAWAGSAGKSRADTALQLDNVRFACDAVCAAKAIGARKFVGAGSIMEDESDAFLPEDGAVPSPNYIYSAAKLTAHYMCKTVAAAQKIDFCWGKISNAYGEGDATGRFLQTITQKLLKNESCGVTEGKQLYDFIYVTEVAKAFADIGEKGQNAKSYYIGTKNVKPLKEYILDMKRVTGSGSQINFGAAPYVGAMLGKEKFDSSKLEKDTGFTAEISFDEGLERYIKWLGKN